MKKIALFLFIAFGSLLNASQTSDDVLRYYAEILQKNFKDAKVSYIDTKEFNGFEVVTVEITRDDMKQEHFMFVKDGLLFSDVLDLKTMKSYREQVKGDKLISVAQKNKDFLRLGAKNKEVMWIFVDVECPHCKTNSKELDNLIKDKQVNLVFLNVVGSSYGIVKSINLEKDFAKAKSDEERLKIIHRYFDYEERDLKASEEEIKAFKERSNKYGELGLEYVPYIVEKGSQK